MLPNVPQKNTISFTFHRFHFLLLQFYLYMVLSLNLKYTHTYLYMYIYVCKTPWDIFSLKWRKLPPEWVNFVGRSRLLRRENEAATGDTTERGSTTAAAAHECLISVRDNGSPNQANTNISIALWHLPPNANKFDLNNEWTSTIIKLKYLRVL